MVSDMELGVELVPKDKKLKNMDAQDMPVNMQPDGDGGMADMGGGIGGGSGRSSGGGGGGKKGMMGMLGSVVSKLTLIAGIVGVLLMLEPIQQLLGMIMRFLEIFILPLVAIFMMLLQPLLQKLLEALPAFMDNAEMIADFLSNLFGKLFDIGQKVADSVLQAIPFVGNDDQNGGRDLTKKQKVASAGALGLASMNPATMPFALDASQEASKVDWDKLLRKLDELNKSILPEQRFADKTDESKKASYAGQNEKEADKTYGGG